MITVVYPLGTGSKHANFEIRLSVALLRKYCQDPIQIIISGESNPLIPDTHYIPKHTFGLKYLRSLANVMEAVHQLNLKEFVLMNDDFFALKPFSFNDFPLYYYGSLNEYIQDHYKIKDNLWLSTIRKSIKENDLFFDLHYPMLIKDIEPFKYHADMCFRHQLMIRSLYGNTVKHKYKHLLKPVKDCKIDAPIDNPKIQTKDMSWLSIGDKFLTPSNKKWLTSLL